MQKTMHEHPKLSLTSFGIFLLLVCLLLINACNAIPLSPDGFSASSTTGMTANPTGSNQIDFTPTSWMTKTQGGTPLSTLASPVWVKSIDESASVHSGPGVDFPIIKKLNNGITVQVTGKTNDLEWLQISIDGSLGWVYSQVVRIDGDLGRVACIPTDTIPCENPASSPNYDTAVENIRLITQKQDLQVTFMGVGHTANAATREALIFMDEKGTRYYVDQETNRLIEFTQIQIDPSSAGIKTLSQLREEAEVLAEKDSIQFTSLKDSLTYSKGTKGLRFFFTWEKRNETGQPVGVIAFQVGLDQTGAIVSYLNTLDLPG